MRLTLRNLLAYMHGTLSPEHHNAFAAMVKNNPRVQLLVNRCQQLKTRSLQGIDLDQTAAQFQVETVAKYLDFTLPDDQIAPFEKAALASDEQLAEIVDAHRILADVIKQRVSNTPPPDSFRERLLSAGAKRPTESASASGRSATPTAPGRDDSGFAPVTPAVREELHDSGDLSEYLSDVDDEEELSLAVVESRARAAEERALSVAAQAYTANRGPAQLSNEAIHAAGVARDAAYEREAHIAEAQSAPTPKRSNRSIMVIGAGVAVCLAFAALAWLAWAFLGSN